MGVPVYRGKFTAAQAERLLWRAGFGPRGRDLAKLSKKGLRGAVQSLTRVEPKKARLVGPKPHIEDGLPLAPTDAWGHDLLWWLDRMVRSNQQLSERMALVWHDWFATADVDARLQIKQNQLFRRGGLGAFDKLLLNVTKDPAMLIWLSGADNHKWAPNENYARELMELFTLGADAGYSENDVREQARALTGWRYDWDDNVGYVNFRFDPSYHDDGTKKIFGKSGRYDWRDSCQLCLNHPAHDDFFVDKLWSYFIPVKAPRKTRAQLKALYKRKKRNVRPLVEAILMHPLLYEGPRMVKPPIVQIAGMLRARGKGIDTESWTWISENAGQRLFYPPNVAGWDDERWLDTARFSGRWDAAGHSTDAAAVDEENYPENESVKEAIDKAFQFWGNPPVSAATRSELERFAKNVENIARDDWQKGTYRALRQNALRMLIVSSPEYQTS
jgi:uncharacterized protein (DUF1800 family)